MLVEVEGQVVADVEVRPSPLVLGTLTPGQSVPKNLVVLSHSKRAFKNSGHRVRRLHHPYKAARRGEGSADHSDHVHRRQRARQDSEDTKIKTDLGDNVVPDVMRQATIVESTLQRNHTANYHAGYKAAVPSSASSTAGGVSNDAASLLLTQPI